MPQQALVAPETLTDLTQRLLHANDFQPLLAALKQNRSATVDGAWGSSAGLVCSALAGQVPATLVVVLAHPRDLEPWAGDLMSFSGLRPVVFPAWDNQPGGSSR